MDLLILILMLTLAAANGANDVSKGVATLAGAGVTRYRTAIVWGALTTLAGGLLSVWLGQPMSKLFSSGILSAEPTAGLALAVLTGTTCWVLLATATSLPVSTTHALVGSLVGAGLVIAPASVRWYSVAQRVATPLLLSIAVAGGISALLSLASAAAAQAARSRRRPSAGGNPPAQGAPLAAPPGGLAGAARAVAVARPAASDPAALARARGTGRVLHAVHWLSSGATGCARALNDTPKIAAVGGFALLPAGMRSAQIMLLVAGAMALGSLLGIGVTRTLGEKVVRMTHGEGCRANLVTSVLVGLGATLALPMSTTQVATGAIVGTVGGQIRRLHARTLRDLVLAWTVTPLVAGLIAASTRVLTS